MKKNWFKIFDFEITVIIMAMLLAALTIRKCQAQGFEEIYITGDIGIEEPFVIGYIPLDETFDNLLIYETLKDRSDITYLLLFMRDISGELQESEYQRYEFNHRMAGVDHIQYGNSGYREPPVDISGMAAFISTIRPSFYEERAMETRDAQR